MCVFQCFFSGGGWECRSPGQKVRTDFPTKRQQDRDPGDQNVREEVGLVAV
jgi:hypothetical protein